MLKKILLCLMISTFLFILAISSLFLYNWISDNYKVYKIMSAINEQVPVAQSMFPSIEDIVNSSYEHTPNTPYISVGIKELKEKNEDTVGWIKVDSTTVSYPVVQCSNNDYYINVDFNDTYNDARMDLYGLQE